MLELKKGDKVIYLGTMPYKLANGQEVEKEGDELFINSNVNVQKQFFNKIEEVENELKSESVEEPKKEVEKKEIKKSDIKSKNKNAK